MSYNDTFGGNVLQPANVSLHALPFSVDTTLVWPPYATDANYLAYIMRATPAGAGLSVVHPDARLASNGMGSIYTNLGASTFTLKSATGVVITTVAAGASKYVYITDNSTQDGAWAVFTIGAGANNLDAASLAGLGLKAITTTLAAASPVSTKAVNYVIVPGDRGATYVWTGGAGTFTLPLSSDVGSDFFFEVRNQGTGVLTVVPIGGETVDGSATVALQVNDSGTVHAGAGAWYTVGRGRNTQFNFTQLVKSVTGGTATLTLTEASNVIQTYNGALASNQIVVLPAAVQIYYVNNNTTGNYSFTFQTPVPGTTASVPRGSRAILFCDGTNVVNAVTLSSTVTNYPPLNLVAKAGTFVLGVGDQASVFVLTNSWNLPVQNPATMGNGWYVDFINEGTGVVTLDPNGYTIEGSSTQLRSVYPGESVRLATDGFFYYLLSRLKEVTMSTYTVPGVGVANVDSELGFTDLEFQRIRVVWSNLLPSATPNLKGRVKKAGAYVTGASYNYAAANLTVASLVQAAASGQTSWDMLGGVSSAGNLMSGEFECSAIISTGVVAQMTRGSGYSAGGTSLSTELMLQQTTANNVQGFRLFPSAGTLNGGTVSIIGIRG